MTTPLGDESFDPPLQLAQIADEPPPNALSPSGEHPWIGQIGEIFMSNGSEPVHGATQQATIAPEEDQSRSR
jgi:hypothetical protein